jgi:hypothetical protein
MIDYIRIEDHKKNVYYNFFFDEDASFNECLSPAPRSNHGLARSPTPIHAHDETLNHDAPPCSPTTPPDSPHITRVRFQDRIVSASSPSSPSSGISSLTTSVESSILRGRHLNSQSSDEIQGEDDAFASHQLHLQVLGLI